MSFSLRHRPLLRAAALFLACGLFAGTVSAHAISGAIYTSTSDGNTVNGNLYDFKNQVYLNGGPSNPPGCNGGDLEDGDYYFQVTDPSGAQLLSSDSVFERKFTVSGGVISAYLGATHGVGGPSDCGSLSLQLIPFANTPNNGGVYKVWITHAEDLEATCGAGIDCGLAGFVPGHTKTDNFKVKEDDQEIDEQGALQAYKFYDANANGVFDAGDLDLPDWKMTLTSTNLGVDSTHYTGADGTTTWDPLIPDSDYMVTEGTPVEGNWVHSATIYTGHDGSPQNPAGPLTVNPGETTTVAFGNYCTKPSNGRTLGFWSNKNGQALVGSDDLALLVSLNLRTANGSDFNPANYAALRSWLLNGNAINMAYMLSVQLAAMELNVNNGFVNGGAYYVPAGMTINQLMAAANTSLGLYPVTIDGNDPFGQRSTQEQLKNWLDQLNNNAGVLCPTPCAYTFP
jgi:hypothetical protein